MKKSFIWCVVLFSFIVWSAIQFAPEARCYVDGSEITDTWNPSTTGYACRRILVKDSSGSLYAVLNIAVNQDNNEPYYVSVMKSDDGGATWVLLPDPGITPVDTNKGVGIAVDSSDNIHLIYHLWETSKTGHFYHKEFNGSSWTGAVQVSEVMEDGGRNPTIAVDGSDNLHVLWQRETLGDTFYCNRIGGVWSSVESIGALGPQTALAIDYNNDVHVVGGYFMSAGLKYKKRTGGTWGSMETIDSTGSPRHASIAIDSLNRPHVAWTGDGYSLPWRIYYSIRESGGWTSRMQISETDLDYHESPIGLDVSDNVYIIYQKVVNPSSGEVQLCYRKKVGGSWTPETPITALSDKAFAPSIRWSSFPAFNRISDVDDVDFIWTERGEGSAPYPYPAMYYAGLDITPVDTPTPGPSFTPSPSPTPSGSPYFIEVTSQAGLISQSAFRLSIGDINGDNYPDLLLHEPINEASSDPADVLNHQFIYLNVPGDTPGTREFVDFTEESGIRENRQGTPEGRHSSLGAFADVDNDGDLDLFLGLYYHRLENYTDWGDRNDLFLNDGAGHFTMAPDTTFHDAGLLNTSGATFVDYDLDGNIDIFVGNWFLDYAGSVYSMDRLYKGNGDGTFTEVTAAAGMNLSQPSYGVSMADYNCDGYPDLFASNYCRGPGFHWHNNGDGTFTEVGNATNFRAFTRCSWGCMPRDFDNDRDFDLFEVYVHGYNTGYSSRIMVNNDNVFTWEGRPEGRINGRPDEDSYDHNGDHYGSWLDADNDGLADFAITESGYSNDQMYFFRQLPDNTLHACTEAAGLHVVNTGPPPHNASPLDYDLDGDEDILIGYASFDHVRMMENVVGTDNNWLQVKLVGQGIPGKSNKSAIGARVELNAGGVEYMQQVDAGNGHFSPQVPLILTFGLGDAILVDSITVHWPNSSHDTQTLTNLAVNQLITIHEGAEPPPVPAVDFRGALLLILLASVALTGYSLNKLR